MTDSHVERIFLFVNPESGGSKGRDLLKVPQPFIVDVDEHRQASLHIFNLLAGESGKKEGFRKLKQAASRATAPVRTIVGGGDGSVMWADTEAARHGIHTPSQLVYGVIPLGTGNNFSRVAGWGGKSPTDILGNDCAHLKKLVRAWCSAAHRPHDVWQVVIRVRVDDGQILVVDKNLDEAEIDNGNVNKLTLPMINYFSIGQECKVGIDFDKPRTSSQTLNMLVSAFDRIFADMKCCSAEQHIGSMIRAMHLGSDTNGPLILGSERDDEDIDAPQLIGNPESLMFLNIDSYAGGDADFWHKSSKPGMEPDPSPEEGGRDADPGDGRLEVVTLPSIAHLPLDRIGYTAKRITSGAPFYLEFLEPGEEVGGQLNVHCEVDGEFYRLVNPDHVSVTLNKTIQVLQREFGQEAADEDADEDSDDE